MQFRQHSFRISIVILNARLSEKVKVTGATWCHKHYMYHSKITSVQRKGLKLSAWLIIVHDIRFISIIADKYSFYKNQYHTRSIAWLYTWHIS